MSTAAEFKIALLEKQNAELRGQLEERDETIRQLRIELAGPDSLPEWLPHLTSRELDFLRALAARQSFMTREALCIAVYGSTEDAPDIKIVDVIICRLRRKLVDHGITIETVWGKGYKLTPAAREILRPRMAA